MTTFDWSLLRPSSSGRKLRGPSGCQRAPYGLGPRRWRPWLSLEYRKYIRNIEVVYKDLYIEEIYRHFLSTNFISYVYTV